jgi:hypothetical protein
MIADGRLVLTSEDHGHPFGLPAPVDAHAQAEARLTGRRVTGVRVRPETADLLLEFEGGLLFEALANSSGYEPWAFRAPGIDLVALGGGGVAIFQADGG